MKKLKTLFVKDFDTGLVSNIPTHNTEWVFNGEGKATIKIDGSSVLKSGDTFYRRMDRKLNKKFSSMKKRNPNMDIKIEMFKDAPEGWIPAEDQPDLKSGHWPGWTPLDRNNPNDRFHYESIEDDTSFIDGTYELIGPTLMMNIYGLNRHRLVKHALYEVSVERSYEGIRSFLEKNYIEGLVFHRENETEDMFKIRRKDFGIVWNPLSDPRNYPDWNGEVMTAELNPFSR